MQNDEQNAGRPAESGKAISEGERIYDREDMGASAAELQSYDDAATPTRGDVQAETALKPHRRAAGDPLA